MAHIRVCSSPEHSQKRSGIYSHLYELKEPFYDILRRLALTRTISSKYNAWYFSTFADILEAFLEGHPLSEARQSLLLEQIVFVQHLLEGS